MPSLSTLFGAILGMAVIAWGVFMATSNWKIFIDLPSVAIVLGGTITSSFIGYRWRYILNAFYASLRVFVRQKITPQSLCDDVKNMVEWSKQIQKEGMTRVEAIGKEAKDPFILYVSSLISTGYTKEQVQEFSETSIEENYFRHLTESSILSTMASAAPAFGMVGTLIGLVVMLSKMDTPSEMGPGLAIALMTTLYGVLAARFIFQPCSTKVKQMLGIQRFREFLILEGFLLIMEKRSSFYIQDKLNSFLDRNFRYTPNSKTQKK